MIGGNDVPPDVYVVAEAVGRELALAGAMLVCGGYGGVMEAASKGAREAGGVVIGVLPDSDTSLMNQYVTIPIVTGIGRARNLVIALTADAVIAVDGSYGTLTEIGFALQHSKPVAGLGTWQLSAVETPAPPIYRAKDAADAVRWVVEAASKG